MIKKFFEYLLITSFIAVVGFIISIWATTAENNLVVVAGFFLLIFSPFISGYWMWKGRKRDEGSLLESTDDQSRKHLLKRRFIERQRLIESVDKHRTTIARNLHRSIKKNDYGLVVEDLTDDALEEFFASIELDRNTIPFSAAKELVFEQLDFKANEDREAGFDSNNIPFDGHAFESWVAEALIGFGWDAEVTSGSGDQGIDVIASKADKKIGLQCKLYSSSVGNKAVQEAHSGKTYYGLDAAGVLSNAEFTSSARDLATVTGILLLSHRDIPLLFEKAFSRS